MKKRCTLAEATRETILREVDAVYMLLEGKLFSQWLDAISWGSDRYELTDAVPLNEAPAAYNQVLVDLVATKQIKKITVKVPGSVRPGIFYATADVEILVEGDHEQIQA